MKKSFLSHFCTTTFVAITIISCNISSYAMDNISPSTENILNEIRQGNVGLALVGIHTRMEESQYFSPNEIEDLSVELNKQADSVEKHDALNTLNNQHQIHKRNKNLEDAKNQNNN